MRFAANQLDWHASCSAFVIDRRPLRGGIAVKTVLLAVMSMSVSGLAVADVPAGPDAINGSFVRMLEFAPGVPGNTSTAVSNADDFQFDQWVNSIARGDQSSLEAGFAHLLRTPEPCPPARAVRGEPDAVAVMVAELLRNQVETTDRRASLTSL